jgi:NADH-quinone oxidoreductase subunit N
VIACLQWRHVPTFDPRAENVLSRQLFTGLLVYDNFTIFLKLFLLGFGVLIIWLTLLTGIPDSEDSADFHVLLLGATLGMMVMASANHLLMVFIGVEMASLPSYAMAGFLKGRRQSSEAALKYVVYGGGSAGVMLYGISLLAGKFGTAYLPGVAAGLAHAFGAADLPAVANVAPMDPMLLLGILFVFIGFGFKLAAVPFHFWCPDVFEGAPAEVAGFLSVASKGAALALTARFSLSLVGMAGGLSNPASAWAALMPYLAPSLAVLAIVTATFGNLAALGQTNLKRLLAYSTIAHAGYMLMGLAALTTDGAAAVLFYLVIYLFMNLGAFAIVAFLRNLTGSEDLHDFRGLVNRAPVLVISLAVCLLSLLGMPPLGGFIAKFQIFQALFDAGNMYMSPAQDQPGLGALMYALLFVLGINSVISLVYYVKVLRVMIIDKPLEEVEGRPPARLRVPIPADVFAGLIGVVLLALGIFWNPLTNSSLKGVNSFQAAPALHGTQAQNQVPAPEVR